MKPFSKNLVFFDTEFSSLDPYQGEILSIGFVKENGEELYLELKYKGEVSNWVKENILPTLNATKVSREEAREKILKFIGNPKPYLVSYVNYYDAVYYAKLFSDDVKSLDSLPPFNFIPIDFATILFALGMDPESYYKDQGAFCKKLGIDISKYQKHNALDDAKLLRTVYKKLVA